MWDMGGERQEWKDPRDRPRREVVRASGRGSRFTEQEYPRDFSRDLPREVPDFRFDDSRFEHMRHLSPARPIEHRERREIVLKTGITPPIPPLHPHPSSGFLDPNANLKSLADRRIRELEALEVQLTKNISTLQANHRTKDDRLGALEGRIWELTGGAEGRKPLHGMGGRKSVSRLQELLDEKTKALALALSDVKEMNARAERLSKSLTSLAKEAQLHEELKNYTKVNFGKALVHSERAAIGYVSYVPELEELPKSKEEESEVVVMETTNEASSGSKKLKDEDEDEDWEAMLKMDDESEEHEKKPNNPVVVVGRTTEEIITLKKQFKAWLIEIFPKLAPAKGDTFPRVTIFPPTLTYIQRNAILEKVKENKMFAVTIPLSSLGRTSSVESEEVKKEGEEKKEDEDKMKLLRDVVLCVCSKEALIYLSNTMLEKAVWKKLSTPTPSTETRQGGFIHAPPALKALANIESERVGATFAPTLRASAAKCDCLFSNSIVHHCSVLNELCNVCTRRIHYKNAYQQDTKLPLSIPILTTFIYCLSPRSALALDYRFKPLSIIWFPRSSLPQPAVSLNLTITPSLLYPVQTPFILHGTCKAPMSPFPLTTLYSFGKELLISKQQLSGWWDINGLKKNEVVTATSKLPQSKQIIPNISVDDIHFVSNRHSLLQLAFGGEEVILQKVGKCIYIGEKGLRPAKDPATALLRTVCTDLSVSSDTGEHRVVGLARLGELNILVSAQLDAILPLPEVTSNNTTATTTSTSTLAKTSTTASTKTAGKTPAAAKTVAKPTTTVKTTNTNTAGRTPGTQIAGTPATTAAKPTTTSTSTIPFTGTIPKTATTKVATTAPAKTTSTTSSKTTTPSTNIPSAAKTTATKATTSTTTTPTQITATTTTTPFTNTTVIPTTTTTTTTSTSHSVATSTATTPTSITSTTNVTTTMSDRKDSVEKRPLEIVDVDAPAKKFKIDLTDDGDEPEVIETKLNQSDAMLSRERVSMELELETELSRKLVRALLGGAQHVVSGAEIQKRDICPGHAADITVYANRNASVTETPSVYTRPTKACVTVGALQQRSLSTSLSAADPACNEAAQQGLARLLGILEAVQRFVDTHTESSTFVLFPREDDAFQIQICPASCHLVEQLPSASIQTNQSNDIKAQLSVINGRSATANATRTTSGRSVLKKFNPYTSPPAWSQTNLSGDLEPADTLGQKDNPISLATSKKIATRKTVPSSTTLVPGASTPITPTTLSSDLPFSTSSSTSQAGSESFDQQTEVTSSYNPDSISPIDEGSGVVALDFDHTPDAPASSMVDDDLDT